MMKGRAEVVEKNTPEQTHPRIEVTTGITEYQLSTLKAIP